MSIERLLRIMARLRDPQSGCPWDREQNFASIAPYTIEEAYEVADAIERGDIQDLRGELGDLLFQVVFHARLAEEQQAFHFDDVVAGICEKLERRHPHVFGDAKIDSASEQNAAWEEHKRRERAAKQPSGSVLDDVPKALPALTRAAKLGKRAAATGFDWPNLNGVFGKIEEELRELRHAVNSQNAAETENELGDVLFSIANLGRHLHVDLETALRATNAKFERRFRYVETRLRLADRSLNDATLEEMDALWNEAKRQESDAPTAKE